MDGSTSGTGQGRLMQAFDLPRRLVAEALGTALLVATVVGSGIMAETLTKDAALALARQHAADRRDPCRADHNSRSDLRRAFQSGRIAGLRAQGANCSARDAALYIAAQIARRHRRHRSLRMACSACRCWMLSLKVRTGGAQWFAEAVAAFGLIATILAGIRFNATRRAVAGRTLHHRGLLVHRLDVVRQSRPSRSPAR